MPHTQPVIWQIGTRFESVALSPDWIGKSITDAVQQKKEPSPALLVLFQQYPDQYPRREIELMITTFPLTRMVSVYGPWCDGDGRNRMHLPSAIRVPVELANQRITRELEVIAGTKFPLPVTGSRDEIFEDSMTDLTVIMSCFSSAEVISPDRPFLEMVSDIIQTADHTVVSRHTSLENYSTSHSSNADLKLVDVDPIETTADSARFETLKQFCADNQNSRLIAMLGFAYPDLIEELQGIGFSQVFSKLYFSQQLGIL